MIQNSEFHTSLEMDGRAWIRGALDEQALTPFDTACDMAGRPGFAMHGAAALAAAIAPDAALARALAPIAPGARPVRAVAVDAGARDSWNQRWHQDHSILVREKHDRDGFTNWSSRAGIWHVDAPREVLERMLAVKVFLTDTGPEGAGEIALGSHLRGALSLRDYDEVAADLPKERVYARRGDVLVTRMLCLHRSYRAGTGAPQRRFRLDYADFALPAPLSWAM